MSQTGVSLGLQLMGISNILCHKQNPKRGPLTVPSLAPCRIFLVNSYLRIELPIFLAHPIQLVRGPGNPVISYHRYQCPPGVSQHARPWPLHLKLLAELSLRPFPTLPSCSSFTGEIFSQQKFPAKKTREWEEGGSHVSPHSLAQASTALCGRQPLALWLCLPSWRLFCVLACAR